MEDKEEGYDPNALYVLEKVILHTLKMYSKSDYYIL